MRKKIVCASLAAFAIAAVLCTSCSGGNTTESVAGTTAKLDRTTGSIQFPLDEFSASAEEFLVIDKANNLMIEHCVHEAGQPMIPYHATASDADVRLFGIWVKSFAEEYAYEIPDGLDKTGYQGDPAPSTIESIAAMDNCTVQLKDKILPTYRVNDATSIEPAAEGSVKAYAQAQGDPVWASTWSEWSECMKKQNINVVSVSAGGYQPQLPGADDKEGQTLIAIDDVQCKDDTNLVQKLSDIMAKYQNIFISENESALIEQKKNLQLALKTADEMITKYDGA